MTDHNRRKFDADQIEQMILDTENPKDRAMLMILLNVADRLVSHEEDEMKMMVEAKRLVMVILFFMNTIIAMVIWFGLQTLGDFREYQHKTDELVTYRETHKAHHEQEEKYSQSLGLKVPVVK